MAMGMLRSTKRRTGRLGVIGVNAGCVLGYASPVARPRAPLGQTLVGRDE